MTASPPPRRSRKAASDASEERRRLLESRRRFLEEGVEPIDVSDAILRSWRRSRAHGLDMTARPALESLSHQQLRELRERNEMLLRAAKGELEALHEDARLSGSIVILTDPTGVVLATAGNVDFAERASRVALRPGVEWSEAAIGTNAIGAAIAEGRPVAVCGAEHFFEAHAILGCSAVPIFDPSGDVIGALDLSNDAGGRQSHTLALVRHSVDQIEQRLFHQRFGRHERMHIHRDPDLVLGPHEGLLAFDGPRLVGANRQALDLLDLDWSALGVLGYDEIFHTRREQICHGGAAEANRIRTLRGSVLFGFMREGVGETPTHRRAVRTAVTPDPTRPPFERAVKVLLDRAVRLVDAGVPIFILGEIGCGKDAFARALHAESRRCDGPLSVVDCAAEPVRDLDRDLFGDGGATQGAIAAAAGGCLCLNGVEVLPLPLQTRLSAALAAAPRDFDVVATGHYALAERVAAGGFSAELMMRIAVHTVELEPLRRVADRRGLIAEYWAAVAPPAHAAALTPETIDALADYPWPGNRRQLVTTLRSLVVLAEAGEKLTPAVLPHEIRETLGAIGDNPVALDVEEGLESITLAAMRAALEAEGGNVARAARRLGIHRSTLYRRLFAAERSSR
ncbi:MAG: sigma 54-interacting transcriptional regulator [Hyphomicrobiales bacterium]|nr:sigma 54-interacting transcriptional regulator [Hyphomicrobiales bacterium]